VLLLAPIIGAVLRIRSISLNWTYSAPKIGANCLHVFSHLGRAIQLDKSYFVLLRLIGETGTGPSYRYSHFLTNSRPTFNPIQYMESLILIFQIIYCEKLSPTLPPCSVELQGRVREVRARSGESLWGQQAPPPHPLLGVQELDVRVSTSSFKQAPLGCGVTILLQHTPIEWESKNVAMPGPSKLIKLTHRHCPNF
jgi:hypothetical protein